jgi:hypothetical protein
MKALTIGTATMIAFVSLANCANAMESANTVRMLHDECNVDDKDDDISRVMCLEYVGAIGDQMYLIGEARSRYQGQEGRQVLRAFSVCGEPAPTYKAMVQAFTDWAERHPERWSSPGAWGVMQALQEAWPCAK